MLTLVERRRSNKYIYLHFDDGVYYSVHKLPIDKYTQALALCNGKENLDFLYQISTRTNDRDVDDSYYSIKF